MKNYKMSSNGGMLLLLLCITVTSCQKLDEAPEGISTPENFYSTAGQCEAAYAGSMNALFSTWNGYQNGVAYPDGHFEDASLDFSVGSFNEVWTWHYKAISNINAVLSAVKDGSLA